MPPLLELTPSGLYCAEGDFYIDPSKRVRRAFITHAHSDHARSGMEAYIAHRLTVPVLKARIGMGIATDAVEYGETRTERGVTISFHPAGHIPGSSQIRVEYGGEVWVVSGDYKTNPDALCTPFEPIACHTFISESTFGVPVFAWKAEELLEQEILSWWQKNIEEGRVSLLLGYSLGKAQRLLQYIVSPDGTSKAQGRVWGHGAVVHMTNVLRAAGVELPTLKKLPAEPTSQELQGALIIAPPQMLGTVWAKKLHPVSTAFASGWMATKEGAKKRKVDTGFVVSDHCDFKGLNDAVAATGASQVLFTHGFAEVMARCWRKRGLKAEVLGAPA